MKIYKCNICGLKYKEEELAKRCENHCKKYHACSLEITKYAIK